MLPSRLVHSSQNGSNISTGGLTRMTAAALITLREGLEAALIVGILLGYLVKIGQGDRHAFIWGGVVVAGLASLLLAAFIQILGLNLEGRAEQIFEGTTMFLAVGGVALEVFRVATQAPPL